MSLFVHGYEDQSNFVVYQTPSQAEAKLVTQFKEYTIKDEQGRDIKMTVSPYYYRDPSGQSMISFQGMQLDSSFTWEGTLSFAPAKEEKKEFPIHESSQRIELNGLEMIYKHLPTDNEKGANFSITLLRGANGVEGMHLMKDGKELEMRPIENSKGLMDRTFYFNIPDKKGLSLILVVKAADIQATSSINVKIVAEQPKGKAPAQKDAIKNFQPEFYIQTEESTMISLRPLLSPPSNTYRIKRDAKMLPLQNAQDAYLEARYGIFRENMKSEKLLLGFVEALNSSYLQCDSQIKITSGGKEESLHLKSRIPLPPRITITGK